MSEKAQAPRGTFDVLPGPDGAAREQLLRLAAGLFERNGYERIETPAFEDTALFARGVGEATEIVAKEMYTFSDQGERSLTLRPEGTAPVCRAYVEHGMHKLPQPVKLWYSGPFFRQEAPQAGRFRQFFQIGCEALGSDDPGVDAESIALLAKLLAAAGVSDYRLRISSLGSGDERRAYADELRAYLRAHQAELSQDVRNRIDLNPLRAFDAKHEGTQAAMRDAPRLLDRISAADRDHFDAVLALLDGIGIGYEIDSTLVRGLDYYTRTVFEFTSDELGAQSGLGGGGRYDGLVELLGGQPTPGVGWAAGIERILTAGTGLAPAGRRLTAFVALAAGADKQIAYQLADALRDHVDVHIEQAGRSLKGQLKQADRLRADAVLIVEGDELAVELKNMKTGHQERRAADTVKQLAERITGDLVAVEGE